LRTLYIFMILLAFSACSPSETKTDTPLSLNDTNSETSFSDSSEVQDQGPSEQFTMSNPAFLMGTNIGVLFNTYYKIGDFEQMLRLTDSASIQRFGTKQLKEFYRRCDLGMELNLKNMTTEGKEKILHYELLLNATKVIRRLHVLVENDTARIVPQHPEKGQIFE
jgi:hypothetical protein